MNIFNLAKNAGTSVEQIERFYARNLPLSPEAREEPAELWGVINAKRNWGMREAMSAKRPFENGAAV